MSACLDEAQRRRVAELAALVLPGFGAQPPAVEIDIAGDPVERVFRSRPDLLEPLRELLASESESPGRFLETLDDASFSLLMTVLCAAYLQDGRVRDALGYPGQQALTPNRGGMFGAEELVLEMLEWPKRYRNADG